MTHSVGMIGASGETLDALGALIDVSGETLDASGKPPTHKLLKAKSKFI